MVWKFHSEGDVSGASGGTLSSVHVDYGRGASLPRHNVDGKDDFITTDDFVHDVIEGEDDNAEDIAEVASDDPEDMEFFQDFINCLDNDDLIYGSPRRLDNFKEMN
jgi:hypothetical protein